MLFLPLLLTLVAYAAEGTASSSVVTRHLARKRRHDGVDHDKDLLDEDDDDDEGDDEEDETRTMQEPSNINEVKALKVTIPAVAQDAPKASIGTGAPGSVVPMHAQAPPGYTMESTYGAHDAIMRGEQVTPLGRVAKTRQRLQDNLYKQAKISTLIAEFENETDFQSRVDAGAERLATETKAHALADMLGGMRKELRKFASPFYLEHLDSERRRLKSAEQVLQADYDAAQAAVGRGPQGWPHPGRNVVVAESVFRRPAALRGAADGQP